jgi:hypothetical protein
MIVRPIVSASPAALKESKSRAGAGRGLGPKRAPPGI